MGGRPTRGSAAGSAGAGCECGDRQGRGQRDPRAHGPRTSDGAVPSHRALRHRSKIQRVLAPRRRARAIARSIAVPRAARRSEPTSRDPTYEPQPPAHRHVPPGRRQSVGATTARRSPFARKRPAAGAFHASAPGRPRGARLLRQALEVASLALLRSGPRQVYRIYSEEDYLACVDLRAQSETAPPQAPAARPVLSAREQCSPDERAHRGISSAAALAAVCLLLGVLVGSRLGHSSRAPAPRTERVAPRGRSYSRPRQGPVRRTAASGARPRVQGRTRARVLASRRSASRIRLHARARAGAALRVATAPTSRPTATAAPVARTSPRANPSTAVAAAEFGFER